MTGSKPAREVEPPLRVQAANTNYPHSLDYILDRPHGYGNHFVFIHVLTPCEVGTEAGRVKAQKGDLILYAPEFPQWNRGEGIPLRNNWLHFTGGAQLLHALRIPLNTLLHPRDDSFIEPSINALKMEIYQHRPLQEAVLALRTQLLLHEIARQLLESDTPGLSAAQIAHSEAFRNLRALLLDRPEEDWTIARMAEYVHLSRSRFCALYKQFFHSEPLNDLIEARLRKACLLLSGSNLTIEAVAGQCGFRSAIHFHRLFRKRFHTSPRRYCPNDAPYGPGQHHLPGAEKP